MKNWIFDEKVHRIRKTSHNRFSLFARYYDAEEVIHKRISWNWENISKSGPKFGPKIMKNWIFDEKVHRIRISLTEPFFAFSQDNTMLKKWFIRAFPEIEKISQNLGLNLGQKSWKIEYLMKRCIGSAKPQTIVFRFFARYYDAEEVIHKGISWNWENISKSGPKFRPIIMKNWMFDEKVHRIRITSQNRFFAFSQDNTMLKKWFIRAFPEIEKISQNLGLNLGQKWWKIEYLMKRCIGSAKPHPIVFRFFARYYDAEEVDS